MSQSLNYYMSQSPVREWCPVCATLSEAGKLEDGPSVIRAMECFTGRSWEGSKSRSRSVLHAFNHLESIPRSLTVQRVMQEETGCKKELLVPPPMSQNCSHKGQPWPPCDETQRTSPRPTGPRAASGAPFLPFSAPDRSTRGLSPHSSLSD